MRLQWLSALCLLLSCVNSYVVIGNDDPLDTAALYDLFSATNGANWVNSTNWARPVTICSWYGVQNCTCSQTCRVTVLHLRFNNLTGSLPESIGLMDQLTSLDLYSNQIVGSLPENAFANLTSLAYLDLSFNHIFGTIPTSIALLTSLAYLDFTANRLSGTIPPEMGSMSAISTMFAIGNNQLNGTLPPELAQLNTTLFYINDNKLSGTISSKFDRLFSIVEYFFISANQFTGPLPTMGCNSTAIINLVLDHNLFNGTIPSCYNGSNFPRLVLISAGSNQLSSTIPQSLFTMTALQFVDFSLNQLRGTLPASVSKWSVIDYLDLSSNLLSGSLPASLSTLSTLRYLNLARNSFAGSFSLLSSKFLPSVLNISHNALSGELMDYPGFISNDFIFKNTVSSSSANASSENLRIFDTRDNKFICPYPAYPSDTLFFRSPCLSTVDSYLSVLIPLAYLAGIIAFLGLLFVATNRRKGCYRVSVRNIRKAVFCATWFASVILLGTDLLSVSKMIFTLSSPVNNCDQFNLYSVFINSMPQWGGLFYSDLLDAAAGKYTSAFPGKIADKSTFASTFYLVDSFSGYALVYRQVAESAFQTSCQSFDGCGYVRSTRTCSLLYPEKAQFGDSKTQLFLICAYAVITIRVIVELTALSLVIHAGVRGALYNPRWTSDFVIINIYSVLLYFLLPPEISKKSNSTDSKADSQSKSVEPRPAPPVVSVGPPKAFRLGSMSAMFLQSAPEVKTEDTGVDTSKFLDKLKITGFKAGLTTREAFIDAICSDPSHESYLWRLLYQGCLKSIPLLLLNFFYATDIAVLGLSPLNALSFLGGIVNVPVLLFQAYVAYHNPPVKLRSYKRYPFHRPAGNSVLRQKSIDKSKIEADSDDESDADHNDVQIELGQVSNPQTTSSPKSVPSSVSKPANDLQGAVDKMSTNVLFQPQTLPLSPAKSPPKIVPDPTLFRWRSKAPPPPPPSKQSTTSQLAPEPSDVSHNLTDRSHTETSISESSIASASVPAQVDSTTANQSGDVRAKPATPAKPAAVPLKWTKSPPPPPPKPVR